MFINFYSKIAIKKREGAGLLSGMYELPNIAGFYEEEEIKKMLKKRKLSPQEIRLFAEEKHVFTHIDWLMKGYLVKVKKEIPHFLWVTREELAKQYALPTAFQKILKKV